MCSSRRLHTAEMLVLASRSLNSTQNGRASHDMRGRFPPFPSIPERLSQRNLSRIFTLHTTILRSIFRTTARRRPEGGSPVALQATMHLKYRMNQRREASETLGDKSQGCGISNLAQFAKSTPWLSLAIGARGRVEHAVDRLDRLSRFELDRFDRLIAGQSRVDIPSPRGNISWI